MLRGSCECRKAEPCPKMSSVAIPITRQLVVPDRRLKDGYPGHSDWAFCLQ